MDGSEYGYCSDSTSVIQLNSGLLAKLNEEKFADNIGKAYNIISRKMYLKANLISVNREKEPLEGTAPVKKLFERSL